MVDMLVSHTEVQIPGHYIGKADSECAAIPPCHVAHL